MLLLLRLDMSADLWINATLASFIFSGTNCFENNTLIIWVSEHAMCSIILDTLQLHGFPEFARN